MEGTIIDERGHKWAQWGPKMSKNLFCQNFHEIINLVTNHNCNLNIRKISNILWADCKKLAKWTFSGSKWPNFGQQLTKKGKKYFRQSFNWVILVIYHKHSFNMQNQKNLSTGIWEIGQNGCFWGQNDHFFYRFWTKKGEIVIFRENFFWTYFVRPITEVLWEKSEKSHDWNWRNCSKCPFLDQNDHFLTKMAKTRFFSPKPENVTHEAATLCKKIWITIISTKMIRWTWNCISDDKISASNGLQFFLMIGPVVFEIGGGSGTPPPRYTWTGKK